MIRLTINSDGCLAEIKKDLFSDYDIPIPIDLNKFLYSFQAEQNFMSDIPIGYFKHVEIGDQLYLWQVFHNTNNSTLPRVSHCISYTATMHDAGC